MADDPLPQPASRVPVPEPDRLPVLDEAHLARQTFDDRELQRELLVLFDAQCERLLHDLGPAGADAAIAAHALKGSANAVGAARVALLSDRLEGVLGAGGDAPGAADLAARLVAAIAEARVAIGNKLRDL